MSAAANSSGDQTAPAAGVQEIVGAPQLIECSMVLLSGEVVMTTRFRRDDEYISVGTLLYLIRDVLWTYRPAQTMRGVSARYNQIRLAIGTTVFSADDAPTPIFSVPEIAAIADAEGELRVNVIVTQEPAVEHELEEV